MSVRLRVVRKLASALLCLVFGATVNNGVTASGVNCQTSYIDGVAATCTLVGAMVGVYDCTPGGTGRLMCDCGTVSGGAPERLYCVNQTASSCTGHYGEADLTVDPDMNCYWPSYCEYWGDC
jgi:hypothetical protein